MRPADDGLALDHSIADVEALESLQETAYVRAGEQVVADPDWDVGTEDVLACRSIRRWTAWGPRSIPIRT